MAVRSDLYTPKLVEAIGKAIVHATVNEGDVTAIGEPDDAEPTAGAGCALEHRLATPETEQGAVRMETRTDAPQGIAEEDLRGDSGVLARERRRG
eukprot:13765245-Heterocapsa_arctica.AAC.1